VQFGIFKPLFLYSNQHMDFRQNDLFPIEPEMNRENSKPFHFRLLRKLEGFTMLSINLKMDT